MDDAMVRAGLVGRVMAAARAAAASEAEQDWDAYALLSRQAARGDGGEAALRCGVALLESADALEREVGCDLVGHAADEHAGLRDAAAAALVALVEGETEACVLVSLVRALGRTQHPHAVPALVRFSGHPDAEVRRQVAVNLAFTDTGLPDGPDVQALIRLTRDEEDPEVRNWAAFALGFQLEQDTTAIRDALWHCTSDPYGEVREEGARGLARRHDLRAVPLIAELLECEDGAYFHTFEAAEILGVPALLPALLTYEADSPGADDAVAACDPVRRARLEADAWAVVRELHRLRPDLGAALSSPRYASVRTMRLTAGASTDAGYDVASLLTRADGDPARAAQLVAADLTTPHPPS
ncbi:HEAT repeat protein [Streptacidiphilus sp. MAP12-33]|uniref:HEAT repeat domain-containing protein n=1 Tax=Streptacidiphilus sp. MAP12-33 TaxID=3156266 RepID=UPI003518D42E